MPELPVKPAAAPRQSSAVALLRVITAQIETALQETNAPATTLVETAHSMTDATQTLARCIADFSGSPVRVFQDLMVLHDDLHARSGKAVAAIQFHDRLVQSLTHVCSSLSRLAEFISSGSPKTAAEWSELTERVRAAQHHPGGSTNVELF
jgi:hypothetical protein